MERKDLVKGVKQLSGLCAKSCISAEVGQTLTSPIRWLVLQWQLVSHIIWLSLNVGQCVSKSGTHCPT